MSNLMDHIWFTSDTHFFHSNIIKHCNRPFSTIEEHDSQIIENINNRVSENDTLYHLGDFAFAHAYSGSGMNKNAKDKIQEYRKSIKCKNVTLIMGNHDPHVQSGEPKEFLKEIFNNQVYRMFNFKYRVNGVRKTIVLCHYSMKTWHGSHRGNYLLYGHWHSNKWEDPNLLSFDVGIDAIASRYGGALTDYRPISLNEVIFIMENKTKAKELTALTHPQNSDLSDIDSV